MLTNPSILMPWNVPFQENVSKGSGLGRYEWGIREGVLCGGNVFGWEAWQRAKWFQRWRIGAFSHRPTGLRCSPSLETIRKGTEELFACLYLWPQEGSWGRPEPRGKARSPGLQSVYTGVYMGVGEARGWVICRNQGVQQRPACGDWLRNKPTPFKHCFHIWGPQNLWERFTWEEGGRQERANLGFCFHHCLPISELRLKSAWKMPHSGWGEDQNSEWGLKSPMSTIHKHIHWMSSRGGKPLLVKCSWK